MSDEGLTPGREEPDEDLGAASEDVGIGDEAEEFDEALEAEVMEATNTAIGSVVTVEFAGSLSAVGTVRAEGDVEVSSSAVGMVNAVGTDLYQSAAVAMVVDGVAAVDQSAAAVVVANTATVENGGAGVLVTGDAALARSWVGVMAARNVEISDDSRVLIDGKDALTIGALVCGGLCLVALAIFLGTRRALGVMPRGALPPVG